MPADWDRITNNNLSMKYQQNMHTYAHELIMWQMSVGYDDDVHALPMVFLFLS